MPFHEVSRREEMLFREIFSQGDDGVGMVVFPRTASGNVSPTRNLTGAEIDGILIDNANNRVIVTDGTLNQIRAYARTANGNTAPLLVIGGSSTGLVEPFGLATDAGGGLVGFGGFVGSPIPTMTPVTFATHTALDAAWRRSASPRSAALKSFQPRGFGGIYGEPLRSSRSDYTDDCLRRN